MVSVTPDTPALRHQLAIGTIPSQENYHAPYLQLPHQDLTFPIGSPLPSNALLQQVLPAASTSTLPPFEPDQTRNSPKRSKAARMRPTKTTTARNLCAVEWVKVNPQGTTDEFKAYFNSLSGEQRLVWEEKSKAIS
ncbi:hypothetical protein HYPSUDRAFT_209978 [Hypholoma sublateritium FD-334 SS-4]|nr:hypothetical protein HYPSUDRAFT_209978 [Hypholoma sublateritium FD-334 SS-4]